MYLQLQYDSIREDLDNLEPGESLPPPYVSPLYLHEPRPSKSLNLVLRARHATKLWLSILKPTPFWHLIKLGKIASACTKSEPMEGFVSWHNSMLTCHGTSVNIIDFKAIVHSIISCAQQDIAEIAFCNNYNNLPSVL